MLVKINRINTKQNFGMPLAKGTYLDKMRNNYLSMCLSLNKYSTPEYKEKVIKMFKVLTAIDQISKNYTVGIYAEKTEKPMIIPPCVLYAYPLNEKNPAIKMVLKDTNFPFLTYEDLCKVTYYVKLIESFKTK